MTTMLFATPAYRTCAPLVAEERLTPSGFGWNRASRTSARRWSGDERRCRFPWLADFATVFSKPHGGRRSRPRPGRARPRRPPGPTGLSSN